MRKSIVKDYRAQIEKELVVWCHTVITQLDRYLIANSNDAENTVVYFKLKGDFYRYLAEVQTDEEKKVAISKSLIAYKMATSIGKNNLEPTNPVYLGLALGFSLFYYEIMGDQDKAYTTAHIALDEAIVHLEDKQDSNKDFSDSI